MTTRLILRGQMVWQRTHEAPRNVYEPAPHIYMGPPVASDRTLAHGIYHRHIQHAPAEQGWMERAQLLDWANIQSTKFLEAAYNAKLLDCAIDMASKVEVYRVLNPAKMLAFTLQWKEQHQDKKVKKVK